MSSSDNAIVVMADSVTVSRMGGGFDVSLH